MERLSSQEQHQQKMSLSLVDDWKTHHNTLTSEDSTETAAKRYEREELAGVGAARSLRLWLESLLFWMSMSTFTIRMGLDGG